MAASLRDAWMPDAGMDRAAALAKMQQNTYMVLSSEYGGTGTSESVTEVPGYLDVVQDPMGGDFYCSRHYRPAGEPSPGKVVLLPITPSAHDPIADWAGESGTERWYRFAFMHTEWPEEPRIVGTPNQPSSQLTVIWQWHDQADTGEQYWEPPLWLIDDGRGYWSMRNAYDVNATTASGTVVRRELWKIPKRDGVWEEIVMHAKASYSSAGFLHFWHNGRKIYTETGLPNTYNHQPAAGGSFNFVEYGIYGGKAQQVLAHTIYHKGQQIDDEGVNSFDEFMEACGSSQRELEGFVTRGVSL